MVRIERLDIRASVRGPVCDDGRFAPAAAGFVAELPGKDGRTRFIAVDYELHISFVSCLGFLVCVERCCGAAEGGGVGVDATEIVPIVEEREDEFEVVFFSLSDGIIEVGNASWRISGIERKGGTETMSDLKLPVVGSMLKYWPEELRTW